MRRDGPTRHGATPELLARFAPGPATLRLTGLGGPKLLRTPAPRVRELAVELRR